MHIVFVIISCDYLSVRKDIHMKEHNQKHLTLSDRIFIEEELMQGSTFSSIAKSLRKDPTTISKEIKLHREFTPANHYASRCRTCMNQKECTERNVCGKEKCKNACWNCYRKDPTKHCSFYLPFLMVNLRYYVINCNKKVAMGLLKSIATNTDK